jgi:hypothetical protein
MSDFILREWQLIDAASLAEKYLKEKNEYKNFFK